MRKILKTSVNPEIQQFYTKTSSQNIVTDDIIERAAAGISEQYELKNVAKKIVEKENIAKIWSNFVEMKEQCVVITAIMVVVTKCWSNYGMTLFAECRAI